MALKRFLTLRRLPSGPRVARPEYRLRGCLEEPAPAKAREGGGRTALIQPFRSSIGGRRDDP